MNEQRKEAPTARQRGVEMLVFLVVSVIGIYALGNGLTGLFEPGKGIDLLWLAVAVVAMMILFAQMGRVQDNWPHRLGAEHQQAQPLTEEGEAKASRAHSEERAG